ncbi:MAG TPA: response regulator transcription factor [Thermomicrobiales bacterium]|nr:response regulator transcription factor [Thermomicrobiales bacterium]
MRQIRVLVVDAHPLYRRGIRSGLDPYPEMDVVGEAAGGAQALDLVADAAPDVVMIDTDLPDMDGLDVARTLKRHYPRLGIVLMTSRDDDEQLFNALRVGAAAYITKDVESRQIVATIRRVARGEYAIDENVMSHPAVAARVLDSFREVARIEESSHDVFSPLTAREVETLEAVALGNTNKEIATLLGISDQTVKNHIASILRKLQVNDRTQAVIFALRHGLIKLENGTGEQRQR